MASFYVAIRDLAIQTMMARTAAGFLSEVLNTEVKIKTFYVTSRLVIHAEDVQVYDLRHQPMFDINYLEAKLSWTDFSEEIYFRNIVLDGVLGNLVKYEGETKMNTKNLFSQISNNDDKDKVKKKNKLSIRIDDLNLSNGHLICWNQNKDKPEKISMDYLHLDIDSINGKFHDLSVINDSVSGVITYLNAKDKCGFILDSLSGDAIVCSKGIDVNNLIINTQSSHIDMDLHFRYNDYKDYNTFVDSVTIIGDIRPTRLILSDIKYFAYVMRKMPDTLQIQGRFSGPVSDFLLSNFQFSFGENTYFNGNIAMKGLPKFFNTYISLDINEMTYSFDDLKNFAIPSRKGYIPLPDKLSSIGYGTLSGNYKGYYNDFATYFNVSSEMGNISFIGDFNSRDKSQKAVYKANLIAEDLNLSNLLSLDDPFIINATTNISGSGLSKENADFEVLADVESLTVQNNTFNNFNINTDFENQHLIVLTEIKEPILNLNFSGLVDFSKKMPAFSIKALVNEADLAKLHLLDFDSKMLLTTNIEADFIGNNIDNILGTLNLENTSYTDSRGNYLMKQFSADISENEYLAKTIFINCDFFDLDMSGIINFKTMGNSIKNYVLNYIDIPSWTKNNKHLDNEIQEFYLSLNLKNTETLSRLFIPKLSICENTSFSATFTTKKYQLNSTFESKEINYNKFKFYDIELKNKTTRNNSSVDIALSNIILRDSTEKNPIALGLENIKAIFDIQNDSLLFNLLWDDNDKIDHNKGNLKASFVSGDEFGGRVNINTSEILINDSLWAINDNCFFDINKDNVFINDFIISSGNQSVAFKGYFPKYHTDTIDVYFNRLDISNFDLITIGKGIDIDGVINGGVKFSGLSDKFTFSSDVIVNGLGINKQNIGDAFVYANWNAPDSSIFIKSNIINKINDIDKTTLSLVGNYFTSRDSQLDFKLSLNDIDISMAKPFTKKVISRLKGTANGNLLINGSLNEPVINGDVSLKNAGCKINYLNTYYTLNHTVKFSENKIQFNDMILTDTLNHKATASGVITHDYLKDFYFDINILLDNFMALNILSNNPGFYGTAIADGDVSIKGKLKDITMNINALTRSGTVIDIPLTGTTSIKDNFIVFVQKDQENDTVSDDLPPIKKKSNFTMNLNASINNDASVNIFLPMNMGTLNATGSGNIRLGLNSNDLSIIGDYIINSGSFNLNFEKLVKRTFDLRSGGSIIWTGDVKDADINVTGVYKTKSSISSLGIEVDSTAMFSNNINVNCIIRLTNKLLNPTLTFGIELPNASDDIKNTVFSVIDTTNQALMSQQIFSLLVLGSFTYSAGSSITRFGTSTYYDVITSQLSSWLSQISKDFDVDLRYTPNDNITNEELEVALSTQLFNDRLTIEGNFGMITNSENQTTQSANNIVGDVDISFKITNRLSLKAYNHSNVNSNYYSYTFDSYSNYTQGVGISYSQSFDSIKEIFIRRNKNKNKNKGDKSNKR